MSKKKYTRTATFLFPLLGVPRSLFIVEQPKNGRTLRQSLFCNAYLSVVGHVSRERGIIYVLMRNPQNNEVESELLNAFRACNNYRSHFQIKGYTILVFKIRDAFMKDYELILKGNYSSVSQGAKNMIFQHHFFSGKPHVLPLIMNKAKVLKEAWEERLDAKINNQEVWPIMQRAKETLLLSDLDENKENSDEVSLVTKRINTNNKK